MFYRECRGCGYAMDPGEGTGGLCDECARKLERERENASRLKAAFEMASRGLFEQMELKLEGIENG